MSLKRWFRRISVFFWLGWKSRGFWLRAMVCYAIGLVVLYSANLGQFDFRFLLRGGQPLSDKIAILTISPNEASSFSRGQLQTIMPIQEVTDFTDSFYWDRNVWTNILSRLLNSGVRAVGVTLFFGDNIGTQNLSTEEQELFYDRRVVWSAAMTSQNRILPPRFANPYGDNMGIGEIQLEADQVVRYFGIRKVDTNHLSLATIQSSGLNIANASYLLFQNSETINFRGASGHFPTFSLTDLLENRIDPKQLEGKVVYIGAEGGPGNTFYTPLGFMNRPEIFANISENILNDQWVSYAPYSLYALGLLALLIPTTWFVMTYPQGVAFVVFVWIGTLIAALSAWLFDQFYFWVPSMTPLVQMSATWVVFVGYQGLLAERKSWALEQEQKLLRELEQLKNNFVSLISHDLKTPIAKIQAVTDQLLQAPGNAAQAEKLEIIRGSSEELNRYIKSIINILRVESRQVKIRHEVTDINELIAQSVSQLRLLAVNKGIRLDTRLEPMFSVEIDPTLIQEVINNLIENAIKYTPENGSITVISKEIENQVHVEVHDTGDGIPPEEMKRIWEKFARGTDQEHKTKGSGLGLYLVKYFIELHGGEVYIDSLVGEGTQVGFWLPVDGPAG